jgi:hypothetical protein
MEAKSKQLGGWVIMAPDEPLHFSIEEQSRRVGPDLEPTVKLTFRINDYWAEGVRKSWSDGVRKSLEEQLNDIMPALVDIGLLVREKRLAMEQQRAAAEAHRRQLAQEEARRPQYLRRPGPRPRHRRQGSQRDGNPPRRPQGQRGRRGRRHDPIGISGPYTVFRSGDSVERSTAANRAKRP